MQGIGISSKSIRYDGGGGKLPNIKLIRLTEVCLLRPVGKSIYLLCGVARKLKLELKHFWHCRHGLHNHPRREIVKCQILVIKLSANAFGIERVLNCIIGLQVGWGSVELNY